MTKISIYLLIILISVVISGCWGKKEHNETVSTNKPAYFQTTCPLCGEQCNDSDINRPAIAALIENSPAARPQSGINKACVVYEAITEGGITRFLALYLHGSSDKIGPIRSARPHFIHIAQDYDATLVHCGESYEALQILTNTLDRYNLNQMKFSKPFWRDSKRKAPHNLYTSTEKLRDFMNDNNWIEPSSQYPSFKRNDEFPSGGVEAEKVLIHFSGATGYRLQLNYLPDQKSYERVMDGKIHVDKESNEKCLAPNIIIQYVDAAPFVTSKKGTYDVSVVGTGVGYFISNGQYFRLRWTKDRESSPTDYSLEDGTVLPLNKGQIWIEVVPLESEIILGKAIVENEVKLKRRKR
jgi:hypothetical protein